MADYDFPTEVLTLPSDGKCYPEDSPLASGTIEIKYMTAKEEEILTSQNLIKKGVVLDKLFESIIVDKTINIGELVLGDKNAIMLATRILGYGKDYIIETTDEYGEKTKTTVDLSKVQTKDIDLTKLNRENLYEFTTPVSKTKLTFKILTHGDELKIDADVKALSRLNKSGVSQELTTRYRYMIQSVDGSELQKDIVNFINNRFLTRDTKAFRQYLKEISPDVNLEYTHVDENGEGEVRDIPMGVGFFWPSE